MLQKLTKKEEMSRIHTWAHGLRKAAKIKQINEDTPRILGAIWIGHQSSNGNRKDCSWYLIQGKNYVLSVWLCADTAGGGVELDNGQRGAVMILH